MKSRVVLAAVVLSVIPCGAPRADSVRFDVPIDGPLPAGTRSFVVTDDQGAVVYERPSFEAGMQGRTAHGASFAPLEARRTHGCRHEWLRIGDDAWVCGDRGELSRDEPVSHTPQRSPDDAMPWPFAFTQRDGVHAYRSIDDALAGRDDDGAFDAWEAHWGFAIDDEVVQNGARFVHARAGRWLARSDLYRAEPTRFAGGPWDELSAGAPEVPFGWVALGDTHVLDAPDEDAPGPLLRRLSRVHVFGTRRVRGHEYASIGDGHWLRADHLRWAEPAALPREIDATSHEHWIDVDLTQQILTAYEGVRPVYATLVSTGGEDHPTVSGAFRIWGRYIAHTMDNTESAHLPNHFRLGDVPYVQFFDGDRGLHAVYWHDHFGLARSHGCVNLAPRDAAFLFDFTAYPLPPGWVSRAMPAGHGTLVRVRGRYAGVVDD